MRVERELNEVCTTYLARIRVQSFLCLLAALALDLLGLLLRLLLYPSLLAPADIVLVLELVTRADNTTI